LAARTTNANGLVTLAIGAGTTTNSLGSINWGLGTYYIQIEIDTEGGTNYSITSTSQLMSVPYALYAANTANDTKVLDLERKLNDLYEQVSMQSTFSLVLLPDSQHYFAYGDDRFNNQISWVIDNKAKENIQFVSHVGDLINNFSEDTTEWYPFSQYIQRLWDRDEPSNRVVPYAVIPGNHDYEEGTRNSDMFNEYMPLSIFESMDTYGGAFETGKSDNTFHTFRAGGKSWLMLMLEFGPRDAVITWANSVVAAHPNHTIIVTTHAYLAEDDLMLDGDINHSPTLGKKEP